MNDLYQKIEQLCQLKNINITAMCREAGVSRGNITDLKKGRSKTLSAMSLSKIANYFGVSIDYLLGCEPAPSILEFAAEGTGLHAAAGLLLRERERRAGIVRKKPAPEKKGGLEEFEAIFTALTPENQAKLLELARLFLTAQKSK
ncbi:MAG TPA: helix-turn-helix transcriptional regulator [Candidatus Acidoferrum sp.]|nr:helix-turn-helix transcriptional regulator [Candidatus Acidoferrum sp.]